MSSKVTITTVPSANADTALVAANPQRHALWLTNNSTAILYWQFGTAAATATTANSGQLATLQTVNLGNWKGALRGFWSAANGSAQISELE